MASAGPQGRSWLIDVAEGDRRGTLGAPLAPSSGRPTTAGTRPKRARDQRLCVRSPRPAPRAGVLSNDVRRTGAFRPVCQGGQLFGREREREILNGLLGTGRGGVLVVHGEAGVGKTALLEYAAEAGLGYRVARTSGVEAERELPFAALQQLCSPLLDLLDRLPQPQQEALGVALGRTSGSAPNPFLVGLAVLGLLSEAAEGKPLLALVDDAQWLDQASARALAFVARRLLAEQIVFLFATRQVDDALSGLPDLIISPLGHRDARALLESALPAPLDDPVLERIVLENVWQPPRTAGVAQGTDPDRAGGRIWAASRDASVGRHRRELHAVTAASSRRCPPLATHSGD